MNEKQSWKIELHKPQQMPICQAAVGPQARTALQVAVEPRARTALQGSIDG